MKKLIIGIVLLVVFAATVSAQETSFGVKGGMNLAKISNVEEEGWSIDSKIRPMLYVGAFVEHKFNDRFGLSPEFVYSGQGVKTEETEREYWGEGYTKYENKFILNYLNIPVLAKIYVVDSLSIDVGPQFGFLVTAKLKDKLTDASSDGSTIYEGEEDIKDDFNTFDMALGVGATYNIGKFMIQGRYNLGLTDIINYDGEKPSGYKASKNNVFQIGVGYRF